MSFVLSNKTYDVLKYVVQVVLPAAASLYFGLGQIWGWPNLEEVVGSIAIITTFLGVVLGISTKNYNDSDAGIDGTMLISDVEDGKMFSLQLDKTPEEIESLSRLVFKVDPRS
jgi:hypothetical protein